MNAEKLIKIGQGAFARVYLLRDGQKAEVLKVFHSDHVHDAKREYLLLSLLDDPGIVRALRFQTTPEPVLFMQYIPGSSLASGMITEPLILQFLTQLADSISAVHSTGFCLNDLKPDNIIVTGERPVLVDFGLATPDGFHDGRFRGTPSWAAFEKRTKNLNIAAGDIYTLALIWLFLEGRFLPHESDSKRDLQQATDGLPSIIHDMLRENPSDRPDIFEVVSALSALSGEEPVDRRTERILSWSPGVQLQAVETLFRKGSIAVTEADEPQRIIRLALHRAAVLNREITLLHYNSFLQDTDRFYAELSRAWRTPVRNERDIMGLVRQQPNHLFLVVGRETRRWIPCEQDNVLRMETGEASDVSLIIPQDFLRAGAQWSLDLPVPSGGVRTAQARRVLLESCSDEDVKSPKTNPLIRFLSAIQMTVPVVLLEALWKDFGRLLRHGFRTGEIVPEEDGVRSLMPGSGLDPDPYLIDKAAAYCASHSSPVLEGRLRWLAGDRERAFQLWEERVRYLRKRHFHRSAYHLMIRMKDLHGIDSFPTRLQMRLGSLARLCKEPDRAVEYYSKIETQSQEETAVIQADMAISYQSLGRFDKAEELYRSALGTELCTRDRTRITGNLASLYVEQKRFADAERTYRGLREEVEKDSLQYSVIEYNLAEIALRTGQWGAALRLSKSAANHARQQGNVTIETSAELIALRIGFATGREDILQLLTQLREDPRVKENEALLASILATGIVVSIHEDSLVAKQWRDQYLECDIADGEGTRVSFLGALTDGAVRQACRIARENPDDRLISAVIQDDAERLMEELQNLLKDGEIEAFFHVSLFLVNLPWVARLNAFGDLIQEAQNICSFRPLENWKQKITPDLGPFWDILAVIHGAEDIEKCIREGLLGLMQLGKLERAVYFNWSEGTIKIVHSLSKHGKTLAPEMVSVSHTILEKTVKAGSIQFFNHLQDEIQLDIHSSIFGLGLRTAVCYPVLISGEIRGVIYADDRGERTFTADEKRSIEVILDQVQIALEKNEQIRKVKEHSEAISIRDTGEGLIGKSRALRRVFELMESVGEYNVNVLIQGPTGSGKELIARALHNRYGRERPFVPVNCAAIPAELLESELFGHVKGAFTGASDYRKGKVVQAGGGTLFLDEIGDMPVHLQAKILRVIQSRVVTPVGSEEEIPVDFRVIAATNQNLSTLVEKNRFREDLLFRLRVIEINVPALTQRKDDIPLLVHHFIERYGRKFGKTIRSVTQDAIEYLKTLPWKGNVRELENTVERAVLLCEGDVINRSLFDRQDAETPAVSLPLGWQDFRQYRKRWESVLNRRYIRSLLDTSGGNISKASRLGGLTRAQIYRLMKDIES